MLTAQGFYGGGFPISGSHEAAGFISEVGEGVHHVKVCDRVIALNQVFQCGENLVLVVKRRTLQRSKVTMQVNVGTAGRRIRREYFGER